MARLTDEDREKILADFHTGAFSQRELAKKYGVSVGTINKITKGIAPKNEHLVNTQIALNTAFVNINEHEMNSMNDVVEEKTKQLLFFQNSALKNQELANNQINEESELYDLKLHSEITSKNKQSVLGKDIDTQVNIQNNQQTNLNEIKVKFLED